MARSAFCPRHPDTPTAGLCMQCRNAFCESCLVKMDGINTCPDCINEKVVVSKRNKGSSGVSAAVGGVISFVVGTSLLWVILLVIMIVFHGLLRG